MFSKKLVDHLKQRPVQFEHALSGRGLTGTRYDLL
jgi:hypothetical protein